MKTTQLLAYAIVILTAIGSLIHTLVTDPNVAALSSPALKGLLGVAAVVVAALLDSLPKLLAPASQGK